ncbi:hypothetical protein Tco_0201084 [Tanacetum coccineum]
MFRLKVSKKVENRIVKTCHRKILVLMKNCFKLQVVIEVEDRLVRQRDRKKHIVSWLMCKSMIDADYQMDQQMKQKNKEVDGGLGFSFIWRLKTMFDPHVEDQVWKNQSDYRVLDWKLYDSCGVHSLRKQNVHIHMLVEKRYPLTAPTNMLNRKLQADHWNEMCYQLLKLITKQLKNQ